jgi:hypothetical protein
LGGLSVADRLLSRRFLGLRSLRVKVGRLIEDSPLSTRWQSGIHTGLLLLRSEGWAANLRDRAFSRLELGPLLLGHLRISRYGLAFAHRWSTSPIIQVVLNLLIGHGPTGLRPAVRHGQTLLEVATATALDRATGIVGGSLSV